MFAILITIECAEYNEMQVLVKRTELLNTLVYTTCFIVHVSEVSIFPVSIWRCNEITETAVSFSFFHDLVSLFGSKTVREMRHLCATETVLATKGIALVRVHKSCFPAASYASLNNRSSIITPYRNMIRLLA